MKQTVDLVHMYQADVEDEDGDDGDADADVMVSDEGYT